MENVGCIKVVVPLAEYVVLEILAGDVLDFPIHQKGVSYAAL